MIVASTFALAIFRLPLLVLFLAASTYFFVTDLISNLEATGRPS